MAPLRGWSERGELLETAVPHGWWQTQTFIAALRHDRVDAPWVLDGPINGESFRTYVETQLLPTLKPGDILVMDVCGRPVGARRASSKSSKRGQAMTCIRPLLRPLHAAGPYGSSHNTDIHHEGESCLRPIFPCKDQNSIHITSTWMENGMPDNVRSLRERANDSEKITINLGYVDLGRVDLLVREGFYGNRSDFVRTAIRNQLAVHSDDVGRTIDRHTLELGLRDYSVADLEAVRQAGEVLHIKVVGLARIAADVSPELARATIGSITVLGALQASAVVKQALSDRIG